MEKDLYKKLVTKYLEKDNREINYQNRIIIPFIEDILIKNKYDNMDVIDISTMYKNWNRNGGIDRSRYASDYTPDILIAENWDIHNKDNEDIRYYILIEVKVPTANRRSRTSKQVEEYLKIRDNVILTDCITWEFFSKDETSNNVKHDIFSLEEMGRKSIKGVCERNDCKNVSWKIDKEFNITWDEIEENLKNFLKNDC